MLSFPWPGVGLFVDSINATALVLLMLLGALAMIDQGWGAKVAAHRRRWRAIASARSAKLIAFANHPALVQFNLRIKMARATRAGAMDRRPVGSPLDPAQRFAGRLEDLVGLYLSPPEHALVWCCDANHPSLL